MSSLTSLQDSRSEKELNGLLNLLAKLWSARSQQSVKSCQSAAAGRQIVATARHSLLCASSSLPADEANPNTVSITGSGEGPWVSSFESGRYAWQPAFVVVPWCAWPSWSSVDAKRTEERSRVMVDVCGLEDGLIALEYCDSRSRRWLARFGGSTSKRVRLIAAPRDQVCAFRTTQRHHRTVGP
jgi:hypothetical protein